MYNLLFTNSIYDISCLRATTIRFNVSDKNFTIRAIPAVKRQHTERFHS